MARTREEGRAAREAKIEALHERLTGAVESLVTGADWHRAMAFAARFRSRSFNNTMLIWSQHLEAHEQGRVLAPEPSYVAGYMQWKSLGRSPAPGGYMIFAPVMARFASATPQDAGSWHRLERGEKPRAGEVVRSKMVSVKPTYVWDVSQTSGRPIPERPTPALLQGQAPAGLWDGLAGLVQERGFELLRVPHGGMIHGANGMTDYAAKTVAVRQDMDPAAQVKTLAHELAHVMLHGPEDTEAKQHCGIGEVEAESVALMIGAAHGLDTTGYTVPYVSTWASRVQDRSPVEIVQATGERVRRTATEILDAMPTQQLGAGDPPGLVRETAKRDQLRSGSPSMISAPHQATPAVSPGREHGAARGL